MTKANNGKMDWKRAVCALAFMAASNATNSNVLRWSAKTANFDHHAKANAVHRVRVSVLLFIQFELDSNEKY